MTLIEHSDSPRSIRLHPRDNVAVVVNDQGVPAGTVFADGLVTVDFVPQSHKVTLAAIAEGGEVIRYGQVIGYALQAIARGSWVNEDQLRMPTAPPLDSLPLATDVPAPQMPLEGFTFEGYRNADGTVGTRNILGITTTVQCVTGVLNHAVKRIRDELLPRYPHVDDVVALQPHHRAATVFRGLPEHHRQDQVTQVPAHRSRGLTVGRPVSVPDDLLHAASAQRLERGECRWDIRAIAQALREDHGVLDGHRRARGV